MRRRVRCFAAEWNIPAADIAPLMKGSSPNFNRICEFCEKHGASIDWIIGGDLKFLRQMKRDAQVAAAINNPGGLDASRMDTRILNIGRSLLELPPEKRDLALIVVQQLRWAELAETLSLDHDRSHYDMVVRHLAEKMEKLRAAYYEMDGYAL